MKKVLQWIGITAAYLGLGTMMFFGIPFLLAMLLLAGLESEHAAMDDQAEAALRETGLTAYTEFATWHDLSIEGTLTAFVMPKYDNHVDNTDLRAGLMSCAAETDGWHVEPVTVADYAARIPAEAAFLLPDVTFDAHHQAENSLSFFDQDSGLFVHLRKGETPKPGSIRVNKLTLPHNGYVYEMETHGGFHGDGSTWYALIVPEAERSSLEATLTAHADWHEGVITNEEYRQLHTRRFFQALPLYPAADVTFEWCSFVDTYARMYPDEPPRTDRVAYFPAAMQDVGACWSMNWLCALYDADTGLFIYYKYDS